MGPRGVGKTTLGQGLSKELNIKYISLGSLARTEMKNQTELGLKMQGYLSKKRLYPSDLLSDLVSSQLRYSIEETGGFVLDGYPRHQAEAIEFAKIMNRLRLQIDFVLKLDTSLETINNRIANRVICENCDYQGDKTQIDQCNCPSCNSPTIIRKDDNEDDLKRYYELYKSEIEPILNILKPIIINEVINLDGNDNNDKLLDNVLRRMFGVGNGVSE